MYERRDPHRDSPRAKTALWDLPTGASRDLQRSFAFFFCITVVAKEKGMWACGSYPIQSSWHVVVQRFLLVIIQSSSLHG